MPRRMIWIAVDVADRFDKEENKSGLVNELLGSHYSVKKKGTPIKRKVASPELPKKQGRPVKPENLYCVHFQTKGQCLQKGCKFNREVAL